MTGWERTGASSAGWNPIHSLNDDEEAFELSPLPFTPPSGSVSGGNRLDEFFERQLFEQRRFDDSVVYQVLVEYFNVRSEELTTPTDMSSFLHNLIHFRVQLVICSSASSSSTSSSSLQVEQRLRQNPALDGCAALLTEWQLLIDSCKIVQRRRDAPVALGFISKAAAAPALLKTNGLSLLRDCDLSEKALWARAISATADVSDAAVSNADLVRMLRASGCFLGAIENLDELLFDLDRCPPQILSVEVLVSIIRDSLYVWCRSYSWR